MFTFIIAKLLFNDQKRLSTWCLSDKESDIVFPRNLTDFFKIAGIEYLFLLTITDNLFPFLSTRFVHLILLFVRTIF